MNDHDDDDDCDAVIVFGIVDEKQTQGRWSTATTPRYQSRRNIHRKRGGYQCRQSAYLSAFPGKAFACVCVPMQHRVWFWVAYLICVFCGDKYQLWVVAIHRRLKHSCWHSLPNAQQGVKMDPLFVHKFHTTWFQLCASRTGSGDLGVITIPCEGGQKVSFDDHWSW